jgi:glutamine synthetase
MSINRFNALDTILNRSVSEYLYRDIESKPISSFFGENVFDEAKMKHYLSVSEYKRVADELRSGVKLSLEVANVIAEAMKKWAMDRGATHFAHWFLPLTGKTAEKHDAFFSLKDSEVIEEFKGFELSQQEPDGSSFPGGGLRSTFEARGYTAWDPSSPAFIFEVGKGKTLCIPTIFVTYSGESLDYKLPLLKSQHYLEESAIEVCRYFDLDVNKVTTTLGWEQEYFLVDEALFNARPDLLMTGRTIQGQHSPKGQQLDDHYFGSIPERVYTFMRDFETECHKLGIPIRTRHNEVGPGQYEMAPIFRDTNVAVDHNQLVMDLIERIAKRHKFRALLHEKPFAGVNGSGKHNNWSMATDTGRNLLAPGANPGKNLLFLTFFMNTIMAVANHADLLRASVATASNDHRLGANEAPPAIVSVFIGETLTGVLDNIEKGIEADPSGVRQVLDLLSKIPDLRKDNTDRNRTSPFAFTGNKFEIRMVGSSQNCAGPMTILNTIVGAQLRQFQEAVDQSMKKGKQVNSAILGVIKKYVKESKSIRFEGDNYSDAWVKEAEKRGLNNEPRTPEALKAYVSKSSKGLFKNSGVFTYSELEAHYDVMQENYSIKVGIEVRTMEELISNHIMPAAVNYQNRLAENVLSLKELGLDTGDYEYQLNTIKRISKHLSEISSSMERMKSEAKKAEGKDNPTKSAEHYCTLVLPIMNEIREHADDLERIIDDQEWPLVKYHELMFIR